MFKKVQERMLANSLSGKKERRVDKRK